MDRPAIHMALVFRSTSIADTVVQLVSLLYLPESYTPAILKKRLIDFAARRAMNACIPNLKTRNSPNSSQSASLAPSLNRHAIYRPSISPLHGITVWSILPPLYNPLRSFCRRLQPIKRHRVASLPRSRARLRPRWADQHALLRTHLRSLKGKE